MYLFKRQNMLENFLRSFRNKPFGMLIPGNWEIAIERSGDRIGETEKLQNLQTPRIFLDPLLIIVF